MQVSQPDANTNFPKSEMSLRDGAFAVEAISRLIIEIASPPKERAVRNDGRLLGLAVAKLIIRW